MAAFTPSSVMFMYLGRRGALTRLTREIGEAALENPEFYASFAVSRQSEAFASYAPLGERLHPVDTFERGYGAVTRARRIPALARGLIQRLQRDRGEAIIDLMPHVWSPLIAPIVRRAGLRYIPIIHDGRAHPGDQTARATWWLNRTAGMSDRVLTLSESVAEQLKLDQGLPAGRITVLRHPDFAASRHRQVRLPRADNAPLRLLFLGRILPYKGLPLFVEMAERLLADGVKIEIGVFGEGSLGNMTDRLGALRAEVVNRWLSEDEISAALARYDVVVLSHIEASQSGVAAAALGSDVPIVATPAGGLTEQIDHGRTGLIASRIDAAALADEVAKLAADRPYLAQLSATISATRKDRSVARFVEDCVAAAVGHAAPARRHSGAKLDAPEGMS